MKTEIEVRKNLFMQTIYLAFTSAIEVREVRIKRIIGTYRTRHEAELACTSALARTPQGSEEANG